MAVLGLVGFAACGGAPAAGAPAAAPPVAPVARAPAAPASQPESAPAFGGLIGEVPPGSLVGSELGTAPRVRVGALPRGSLDKAQIQQVMRAHRSEIRFCSERELVSRPELAGTVVVKFVIKAGGEVGSAEISSSTLGNPNVESCITRAMLGWTFPRPRGGGIVIVNYPYKLQTADAP